MAIIFYNYVCFHLLSTDRIFSSSIAVFPFSVSYLISRQKICLVLKLYQFLTLSQQKGDWNPVCMSLPRQLCWSPPLCILAPAPTQRKRGLCQALSLPCLVFRLRNTGVGGRDSDGGGVWAKFFKTKGAFHKAPWKIIPFYFQTGWRSIPCLQWSPRCSWDPVFWSLPAIQCRVLHLLRESRW